MYRFFILATAMITACWLAACALGDISVDATPELTVHYYKSSKAKTPTLDAGAYIDLEYTWRVGSDFKAPDGNLRVFVHFLDSEGEIIKLQDGRTLQDDHDIQDSLKEWKPGEPYVYTRDMFKIPETIGGDNYLVTVVAGLYNPENNNRAILAWEGAQPKNRAYEVARFFVRRNRKIKPMPYDESWNGPEPPEYLWRWSQKESTVVFERDKKVESAELVFAGHSPAEDMEGNQRMRIYIHQKDDDHLVKELVYDMERVLPTRVLIPDKLFREEEFLGSNIRIIFEVDRVIHPSNEPRKELGFMFKDLLLQPRDPEN